MKHFSKVLALLLATLMLVTALPVGAFELPSRTVSENLENTSDVDYLFKYDFEDLTLNSTTGNVLGTYDNTTKVTVVDPKNSPYLFAAEAGGFPGKVKQRTDSEGSKYISVSTPIKMSSSNWKGYFFHIGKEGVGYNIGNTFSVEFDFLWEGSINDTNAATGDLIYMLRFRRKTSTDNNLLVGSRQSDGSLNVTLPHINTTTKVEDGNGTLICNLPAADSASYTGKFTKFKVIYYDTTQTFTVYVNNEIKVESQAVISADTRIDGTYTKHTFDEDMLTTSIDDLETGHFRSFTLCRTNGAGDTASANLAPVYKYGLDNIVVKEVKTGSDNRVPFYQNSFEASIGNLVDATHTEGKGSYSYKVPKGIVRATETVGNKTNGYLSVGEGSRFNLIDKYQFAQNGNYIVSFDVRTTVNQNNSDSRSALLRIHDGANTRTLLSVNKSNQLYLGDYSGVQPIPGVTLSNVGAGNKWTHIDLSVMVDEGGNNRGVYDDYSQKQSNKSLRYHIALWVNGSFVGAYNDITRAEYLVGTDYNTASATYGLTTGKFINDDGFKRVFLTAAPTIPSSYIVISESETLKQYKNPSTGDIYQLAYDENGALIPGAHVYDIKAVTEANLPDFTAKSVDTNKVEHAHFAAGVTTTTEAGTVTRYDIAYGGYKVKTGTNSSTTTVVGDYVEVTKDTEGNFVSCKLYDITGKATGSFKMEVTGLSQADVIGFSTETTTTKVKVDFDNIEVHNGVTPKNWMSAKDATTGVLAEVNFVDISTSAEALAMRSSKKGGLGGVVNSSLWDSTVVTPKDANDDGVMDYVTVATSGNAYLDLYSPNAGGKIFSAELELKNFSSDKDTRVLRLRRQADMSSSEVTAEPLWIDTNGNLYFTMDDVKCYLCDIKGNAYSVSGNTWTTIEVIFDETGDSAALTYLVNGEVVYYFKSGTAVHTARRAIGLTGILSADIFALKDAPDQRIRFYQRHEDATDLDMDIKHAKIEYTTVPQVTEPQYLDYAAIDFSKFESLADFDAQYGHQFIWSDGVTLENGVLSIPEYGYLTWIDYNETFADFVDTNSATDTGKHLAGYNIEAKIKVDPYKANANNRPLFRIDHDTVKDDQMAYVYNYDVANGNADGMTCAAFCMGSARTGAIINNTSSDKFSNVAATFDTGNDKYITYTVDGQLAGRVFMNKMDKAHSFAEDNRVVAFDIVGRADIAELYIHADLKRTLDSRDGNIFEYDPDVFTPSSSTAYPDAGYWTPSFFNTYSNEQSTIETYTNEESGESFKYFRMDMKDALAKQSYSEVYLDGYLDDKITVFEYDLRFEAYEGATQNLQLCYIRNSDEGIDNNLGTSLFNISPTGEFSTYKGVAYANPNDTEPIKFSSELWQKVAIIYDTNAGKVSYRLDGKIPYYKDADGKFVLADNIQLTTPRYYRMDTEGLKLRLLNMMSGYKGKFELANFKIYNINENANADYIGIQQSTSERDLRLVAGVDMLYYSQAGFDIEVFNSDGNNTWTETKNLVTNTVYSSINQVVYDENGNSTSVKVYPENFGYRYFLTANITEVTSAYAVRMNVTPYTVVNGVKYPSDTVTLEIDLTEENMEKWICKTDSILVAPKGTNTSADANFSATEIVSYTNTGALEFNGLDAKFAFAANLNGGVVSVNLTNAFGEVVTKSKFDIYVDDFTTPVKTEELEFGHHTVELARDLTGEHKFMIVKRTGGDYACINSMSVTGTLTTPPELAVENAVEVVVADPGSKDYGDVNVYVRTSDSSQKYYIKYQFSYINYALNSYSYLTGVSNTHNNAKMYRINTAALVEKNENGTYSTVYELLQGGEISLAISEKHLCTLEELQAAIPVLEQQIADRTLKVDKPAEDSYIKRWNNILSTAKSATAATNIDASDFVGGWHGDENIENDQIYMYIDGEPINLKQSGTYTGTHFEFDQTSLIDRCDEEETQIMRHRQYMLLDTNGLRNDQSVEFLTNDFTVRDTVTYLQMCTFNRQNKSLAATDEERYNPENYVCDAFNILDANGNVVWYQDLSTHKVSDGTKDIGDNEEGVDTKANRYVEYIGNADDEYGKGLYGKVGFTVDDCSVTPSKIYVMVRESQGDNKWYASFTSHNSNTVFKGEKWNISDYYYFDYAPNDYVAPSTDVEAE